MTTNTDETKVNLKKKLKLYCDEKKEEKKVKDVEEDVQTEMKKIRKLFKVPEKLYDLKIIKPVFKDCLKFDLVSGTLHLNSPDFLILSRGYQGPAVSIAAIVTTYLIPAKCWTPKTVDQVLKDGDRYYKESYKRASIKNRTEISIADLQPCLRIQKTKLAKIHICDAEMVGNFQATDPRSTGLIEAAETIFSKRENCVLTSPILNIAIWKSEGQFYIFDGQERNEDGSVLVAPKKESERSAKLFILPNLKTAISVILTRSGVQNESFVIQGVDVKHIHDYEGKLDEGEKTKFVPVPGGYTVVNDFRAVVRGSFHLGTSPILEILRPKSHLILAVSALVYTHLVDSNRWSTPLIDLIFDHSNIYLMDLVLMLGKKFEDNFEIFVKDLLTDFLLGVYAAKIKVTEHVVPGLEKKAKMTLEEGLNDFFKIEQKGVLEMKKSYYAVWKFHKKFYFFDPEACNNQGLRLDPSSSANLDSFKTAACSVFMASSLEELTKLVAENVGATEKDPFVIHKVAVLYIKTKNPDDPTIDNIIYRAENINRRPEPEVGLPLKHEDEVDETEKGELMKKLLEITHITEGVQNMAKKFPDHMKDVEIIILTEETEKNLIFTSNFGKDYRIDSEQVVVLEGSLNIADEKFGEGRLGVLPSALVLVQRVLKPVTDWTKPELDEILETSEKTYKRLLVPQKKAPSSDSDEEEEDDEEDLPFLEISELPPVLPVGNNEVNFNIKLEVETADSDPEELQPVLEQYFEEKNEMVLEVAGEDKYCALWKEGRIFFLFNPNGFGSDSDSPVTLFATDQMEELLAALEEVSEGGEIIFHSMEVSSIQTQRQGSSRKQRISADDSILTIGSKPRFLEMEEEESKELLELKEKINSPDAFTLFLISCNRSQKDDGTQKTVEEKAYEKIKTSKPYLFPEKRILCTLLEAKQASHSVQSLLSRFSVDSRLPMKEKKDNTIQQGEVEKLKLIKLPPNIYFYSQTLSDESYPVKSIKGFFVKKDKPKKELDEDSQLNTYEDIAIGEVKPILVPLGPVIRTPVPVKCKEDNSKKVKKKVNLVSQKHDIVFNLLFKEEEFSEIEEIALSEKHDDKMIQSQQDSSQEGSALDAESETKVEDEKIVEVVNENENNKLKPTNDGNVQIIRGTISFKGRSIYQACYYKPCFISSMLMILAKSILDVHEEISHCHLDFCIIQAKNYHQQISKLRYKAFRRLFGVEVLETIFNVIIEEAVYGDPENFESQSVDVGIQFFLSSNQTGIIVFQNVAYAFWISNGYWLFDSYGCDEDGSPEETGDCALTFHPTVDSMIERLVLNTGGGASKSYRIYKLAISHMSPKKIKRCREDNQICLSNQLKPDQSSEDSSSSDSVDSVSFGFLTLPNYNAAVIEIPMDDLEPTLVPSIQLLQQYKAKETLGYSEEPRGLEIPVDLCIMAWSQINDPTKWDVETLKALYEVSKNYSVYNIPDLKKIPLQPGAESQFNIENYCFRAAFAPLFHGDIDTENAPLSSCLKKTFEIENYSGAIVCLGNSHVGAMKNDSKFYAWWAVKGTNNIRLVTSDMLDEVVNIIFEDIECKSVHFTVRPVRVSYANQNQLDWISDVHERSYDPASLFKQTIARRCPIFVYGTNSLKKRDKLREPKMRKCYFAAVMAVLLKRDIILCQTPGIIDNIVELADFLHKKVSNPRFYSDLILHKVPIFNRIFDFRDHALQLVKFKTKSDFLPSVKFHLKKFFRDNCAGIIQFSNCCYGFWYCRMRKNFYYLDPYGGNNPCRKGQACLGVFPNLTVMVKDMYSKMFSATTGFFIHRIHVNSVNIPLIRNPSEDPIWTYIDYFWKYNGPLSVCKKKTLSPRKPRWRFYTIEIPNCIYSLWGSVGTFDSKFEHHAGKNKAAICVAVVALKELVQEDDWSSKFLDFCVCQGHKYYLKSQKNSWKNKLSLQPCFTISPYFTWDFKFDSGAYGKLFDNTSGKSLREMLDLWLKKEDNSSIILECEEITLAILKNDQVFYIVNPCWKGLPIFPEKKGAIFVLRCLNFSSLLFALVKSINSNQQNQFCLTSVSASFYKSIDYDGVNCLRIPDLLTPNQKPLGTLRLEGKSHPGPLCSTCPCSDSLECFETNLKIGLLKMAMEKEPKPESCERKEFEIPKNVKRVKCAFPRLTDFLEGQVTSEKIPKRQKVYVEPSVNSLTQPLTRNEFKFFTYKWKRELCRKYFWEAEKEEEDEEELDYMEETEFENFHLGYRTDISADDEMVKAFDDFLKTEIQDDFEDGDEFEQDDIEAEATTMADAVEEK